PPRPNFAEPGSSPITIAGPTWLDGPRAPLSTPSSTPRPASPSAPTGSTRSSKPPLATPGVDARGTHPGLGKVAITSRYGVGIERDHPGFDILRNAAIVCLTQQEESSLIAAQRVMVRGSSDEAEWLATRSVCVRRRR